MTQTLHLHESQEETRKRMYVRMVGVPWCRPEKLEKEEGESNFQSKFTGQGKTVTQVFNDKYLQTLKEQTFIMVSFVISRKKREIKKKRVTTTLNNSHPGFRLFTYIIRTPSHYCFDNNYSGYSMYVFHLALVLSKNKQTKKRKKLLKRRSFSWAHTLSLLQTSSLVEKCRGWQAPNLNMYR